MQISAALISQIIFALVAIFAAAFGTVAALRLHAFLKTLQKEEQSAEAERAFEELLRQGFIPRPQRKRTTQCFNLTESAAIRTVKGGFIRAYRMELEPTMFARDEVVEMSYDEAAALLSQEKPDGTILHFRIANFNDGGRAMKEHREAAGKPDEVHQGARRLHEAQLDYFDACIEMERYKDFNASVWAFIPLKHAKDNSDNGQLVQLKKALAVFQTSGVRAAMRTLFDGDDGIIRRVRANEEEARERAEKTFRQLEDASPVKLVRMTRDETWEALYYGHNESATSVPPVPPPHADLRAFLCRDAISARKDDWHVLHGRTPVAMLSLFVPPEDGASTDILRSIILNARLSRRFTLISEYKYIEKAKARKNLKWRAGLLYKASINSKNQVKMDEDTERAYVELKTMSKVLTRSQENLTGLDFRILVYGEPVTSRADLKERLKQLELDCEQLISVIRKTFAGGDAGREEGAALRALYHRSLPGEMARTKSYRTIQEATDTLAPFIPLERAWRGIKHPHSLVSTTNGNLIGLNFFENQYTSSALGFIIAEPGGGKSVAAIRFVSDILGTMPGAHGAGVDYGESFAPFADFAGGKKWRFVPDDIKPINVWDYDGLEQRMMPDDTQKNFVIEDALILARAPREGTEGALHEAVIRKCVNEVYQDEVPNNRPGWPRVEPQHKHLVNKLYQYPFEGQQKVIALNLASILEEYVGNGWIDGPTHPEYRNESVFDVFELDSLDKFAPDIRKTLAFRVAARVCNRIGKLDRNGELMPTILVFDEMRRTAENYPEIMKAIRFNAARQGRKKRAFTLLCSQSWDDFMSISDITATAGVKIIGQQAATDGVDAFVKAAKWTERAKEAIYSIKNIKGLQSQFVISFGAGHNMQTEMIQLELSPVEYWTYTTTAIEQNARQRVLRRVPQWTMPDAILYLALKHPRGLTAEGLREPDLSELPLPLEMAETDVTARVPARTLADQTDQRYLTTSSVVEEATLTAYRQLSTSRPEDLPAHLQEFAVMSNEAATDERAVSAPVDALQLTTTLPAATQAGERASDSLVIAEYAGSEDEAAEQRARSDVYDALENLFNEHDKSRGRLRADELGVDVEGAIVVER